MKWVWVVGGGLGQLPLIKEFLTRDVEVVVGDRDPQCAASTIPGVTVMEADTYDHIAQATACHTAVVKRGHPSGVMTAGIDATEAVSIIAETYHLPGVPFDVAHQARTKHLMRKACAFDHPWWTTFPASTYPLPWVVKATNASASRGLSLVHYHAEVPDAIDKAAASNYGGSKVTLIEEYLHGPMECATDWFVDRGHIYYINGTYRWFEASFGLETGYVNPATPHGEMLAAVQTATTALGVTSGPFKADFILDDRYGWTLLECSTRWSGSFDHTLAATYATGRNLSATLVDYALGLPFDPKVLKYDRTGYVACHTPVVPPGTLLSDTLQWTLLSEPHIIDVVVTKNVSSVQETLSDRPLFIFARGPTVDEAKRNARNAWQAWQAYTRTMDLGGADS